MKKNIYISLAIICILCVVSIQSIPPKISLPKESLSLSIDKEKLINSPYAFIFAMLCLLYLVIFSAGIANLLIFTVRKFRKRPLYPIHEKIKAFGLSRETTCKLIFLISFLALIVSLLPLANFILKWGIALIDILLLTNIFLGLGIASLITLYMGPEYLGFNINKKHFYFLLRVYSIVVPVSLLALFLNTYILDKLGIEYSTTPVVEIFSLLRSKISLVILAFQIVILGPLAEELFFRGFIYKLTRSKYSFLVAAVLNSVFFSLIHRTPQNILALFAISFSLCYVYEKTQNILAPVIFHSLHNLITLSFFLVIRNLT